MTSRAGVPSDLAWIRRIIESSPEAAQWLPTDDILLVIEPHGFLAYRQVAPDEFEILNLAVALESRRKGIARSLLLDTLTLPGRWFLEVRASNFHARELYRSTGFQEAGIRQKYYQNPNEDAIVLVRQP